MLANQRLRLSALLLTALLAGCGGGDGPGETIVPPDGPGGSGSGSVEVPVNWTIRRLGATSTCAAVGASVVRVTVAPETGSATYVDFQCVLPPGRLFLDPGRYAISGLILDNGTDAPAQAVTVPATGTGPIVQLVFEH